MTADGLTPGQRWHVQHGSMLSVLRRLPDCSIDAVVTDPPYELSDCCKTSAARVGAKLLLPYDAKLQSATPRECNLVFLAEQVARLGWPGCFPGPAATVPEVAVALDDDPARRDNHVEDGTILTIVSAADADGVEHKKAERTHHLGSFQLKCADAEALVDALNTAGSSFLSGGIGVGFRIAAPCLPSSLGVGAVVDDRDAIVRLLDDALSTRVGAGRGTEDQAVARLPLAGGAVESLSASAALVLFAVFTKAGAQLVRADATTGGLPPVPQPNQVRFVVRGTDRALAFDLLIHPQNIASNGFMGRAWDGSKVSLDVAAWREVLRVLKPGAHLLCFGGTRTAHRIACAIEDAGFEIRDTLMWVTGQGFPKSLNCGEGRGTALKPSHEPIILARVPIGGTVADALDEHGTGALNIDDCRVAHASAADLKAHEDQVAAIKARGGSMDNSWKNSSDLANANDVNSAGRWPPNLLLTHSADCQKVGTTEVKAHPTWDTPNRECEPTFTGETVSQVRHGDGETETIDVFECAPSCPVRLMDLQSGASRSGSGSGSGGIWTESTGKPAGDQHGDSGGASRFFPRFEWSALDIFDPFFYCAKAARAERDLGLDAFEPVSGGEATNRKDDSAGTKSPRAGAGRNGGARNIHPTVKPVALMRWLCRLITPPGGIVLDPFCGSGTTGIGALLEGFRFYGVELNDTHEEPFASIARARIQHVIGGDVGLTETAPLRPRADVRQGSLF